MLKYSFLWTASLNLTSFSSWHSGRSWTQECSVRCHGTLHGRVKCVALICSFWKWWTTAARWCTQEKDVQPYPVSCVSSVWVRVCGVSLTKLALNFVNFEVTTSWYNWPNSSCIAVMFSWKLVLSAFFTVFPITTGCRREQWWQWVEVLTLTFVLFY